MSWFLITRNMYIHIAKNNTHVLLFLIPLGMVCTFVSSYKYNKHYFCMYKNAYYLCRNLRTLSNSWSKVGHLMFKTLFKPLKSTLFSGSNCGYLDKTSFRPSINAFIHFALKTLRFFSFHTRFGLRISKACFFS